MTTEKQCDESLELVDLGNASTETKQQWPYPRFKDNTFDFGSLPN